MRLCAFDLETTGLSPQRDQILQIAAIAFDPTDLVTPVEDLPYFSTDVRHDRYEGDAFALQMNAWLLKRIAKAEVPPPDRDTALNELECWIRMIDWGKRGMPHPVGFNVAAFDVAFVKAAGFDLFDHRPVELGTLMSADGVPVTSTRAVRTYLHKDVAHDALADARDAVRLHRAWAMGEVQ